MHKTQSKGWFGLGRNKRKEVRDGYDLCLPCVLCVYVRAHDKNTTHDAFGTSWNSYITTPFFPNADINLKMDELDGSTDTQKDMHKL